MGGDYHGAILAGAAVIASASLVMLLFLAWAGAGRTLDGSVLAVRLNFGLPSWQTSMVGAALWFALGEHIEPHHAAASPLVLLAVLAVASWLLRTLACVAVRCISGIVIAIRSATFAPRTLWRYRAFLDPAPIPHRLLCARRRYVRPPPIATAG